jgi:Protein of unknown function (DUF2934)
MASKTPTKTAQSQRPVGAPRLLTDTAVARVLEAHESAADTAAAVDPEVRHEMIATAAYYIAEQRGFAPGHETADWQAAESAVDASLLRGAKAAN